MAGNEKAQELLAKLENGIASWAANPDNYVKFLKQRIQFHQYSWNNTFLILLQCPIASYVKGYNQWLDMGRCVRKGEKGLHILAPNTFKREVEREDGTLDVVKGVAGFRTVAVFDYSQTDPLPGKEATCFDPDRVETVAGLDEARITALDATIRAIAENDGVVFTEKDIPTLNPTHGGWHNRQTHEIFVRKSDPLTMLRVLIHEYAHHKASAWRDEENGYAANEVIAESVAYVVSGMLGLDIGEMSVPYVATWLTRDAKGFKAAMRFTSDAVQKIMDEIEKAATPELLAA